MKKINLMLSISALLYGACWTYVLADAESDQLQQYLENTPENAPYLPEGVGETQGFDPPQALPKNVAVAKSNAPVILSKNIKMCDSSFQVNGLAMAKFPVTVNGNDVGVWSMVGKKTVVTGNGWKLELPVGDTWSSQWKLTITKPGTVITSLLLEPFKRKEADKMRYVFDIGGKLPVYPAPRPQHEHTPDAARGQFIVQAAPRSPSPIFTATYSYPVYTTAPIGNSHGLPLDSTDIALAPPYGNGDPRANYRKPTHDLYSTLKIEFLSEFTEVLVNPGLSFIADTDCILSVREVTVNSYENGILKFTVVGEGAVVIMENDQTVVQGPFVVERGDGKVTFTTQFIPQSGAGACYNMTDVDTLKVMTPDYCF